MRVAKKQAKTIADRYEREGYLCIVRNDHITYCRALDYEATPSYTSRWEHERRREVTLLPIPPFPKTWTSMPVKQFKRALNKIAPYSSKQIYLDNVLWASDGRRLAAAKIPLGDLPSSSIAKEDLVHVRKFLTHADHDTLDLGAMDEHLVLRAGNSTLWLPRGAEAPDLSQYKSEPTWTTTLDKFQESLTLLASNQVHIHTGHHGVTIEHTQADPVVLSPPVMYTDPVDAFAAARQVAISLDYLIDVSNTLKGNPDIWVTQSGPLDPVILDTDDYLFVIMPMRWTS